MIIKQISIFVENKKGRLAEITETLSKAGANIRALSIADTTDFGILRIIVDKPDVAAASLKEAGITVSVTNVIAIGIEDVPGAFSVPMRILSDAGIDVEYMYAFTFGHEQTAVMVFRFENPEATLKFFHEEKIDAIKAFDLFK